MASIGNGIEVQLLDTKDCIHCYQQIDERAQRCPFCRVSQQRRPWLRRRAYLILWAACICVVASLVVIYFIRASHNEVVAARDLALLERDVLADRLTQRQEDVVYDDEAPVPFSGPSLIEVASKYSAEMLRIASDAQQRCRGFEFESYPCRALLHQLAEYPPTLSWLHDQLRVRASDAMRSEEFCEAVNKALFKLISNQDVEAVSAFQNIYLATPACRAIGEIRQPGEPDTGPRIDN
jgi:hypothetical protein